MSRVVRGECSAAIHREIGERSYSEALDNDGKDGTHQQLLHELYTENT